MCTLIICSFFSHIFLCKRYYVSLLYFTSSFICLMQDYEKFWDNFGKYLKMGCIEDRENHKRIAPLLRFFSSQSENEMISLDEYVENMKPDQKDIYFIAADSVTSAKNTPFLERLLEKDLEVCTCLWSLMLYFKPICANGCYYNITSYRFCFWWILLTRLPSKT